MEETIYFHKEDCEFTLEESEHLLNWIQNTIVGETKEVGDINYVFCSDSYLHQINIDFLNHDYYTDIITFDYVDESVISGDLFISIDRVFDNAKVQNISIPDELHRVMIHGVLHLCGYGDKTDEEKSTMRSKEDFYLSLRGF